ncbi:DUF2063 domain-containing protein [Rhodobacterales bacterium]|nr:DUF2063 domain-containing protein [Rhodobacterales bacterium]
MAGSDAAPKIGAPEFANALLNADAPSPPGLIGPDGKAAPKRFAVYRNNVIVSLCEALGQTYPAVRTLLGDDYFNALARAFVTDHPPSSPVLIWYGGAFADFVEAFPPLQDYPYLADVARAEWAWLQAYHAEDAAPLDPAVLGSIDPEKLASARFVRHPATSRVSSEWPLADLLRANRFSPGDGAHIDLGAAQSLLITRPDLDVDVVPLRPGGAAFVDALLSGAGLGEAAGLGADASAEFSLSDCLSDCLGAGAFKGLETN